MIPSTSSEDVRDAALSFEETAVNEDERAERIAEENLLPCPFCIPKDNKTPAVYFYYPESGCFVICSDCLCRGPRHGTWQDAAESWNTRA